MVRSFSTHCAKVSGRSQKTLEEHRDPEHEHGSENEDDSGDERMPLEDGLFPRKIQELTAVLAMSELVSDHHTDATVSAIDSFHCSPHYVKDGETATGSIFVDTPVDGLGAHYGPAVATERAAGHVQHVALIRKDHELHLVNRLTIRTRQSGDSVKHCFDSQLHLIRRRENDQMQVGVPNTDRTVSGSQPWQVTGGIPLPAAPETDVVRKSLVRGGGGELVASVSKLW